MPYTIVQQDEEYCVYKEEDGQQTGDSLGCHASEDEAREQIQALNASEDDKEIGESDVISLFVGIPLSNHAAIVSAQERARQLYPDAEWVDPESFHMTLCYIERIWTDSLTEDEVGKWVIDSFDPVAIEAVGFGIFNNPDQKAIYLMIKHTSELKGLQAQVFSRLVSSGQVSEYSKPERWQPHITIGYMPDTQPVRGELEPLTMRAQQITYRSDDMEVALVNARQSESQPTIEEDTDTAISDEHETTLIERVGKAFSKFLRSEPDEPSAFRVIQTKDGRYAWFARWSNNFKDREGEWFSERAIRDYVQRVDAGIVPPPELWAIHTPGTKHGSAELVAQVGHFVVSAGYFDDTPLGRKAAEAYAGMKGLAMSHGFIFDPDQFKDNVYHDFNTFEISVLPRKLAANPYTTFQEIKSMTLTDEKRSFLRKLFGDEADAIIADTEKASKALEEANVAFKDFASLEDSTEHQRVKDAAANAKENFTGLLGDLIGAQAELANQLTASVKAYEDLLGTIKEQAEQIKALQSAVDARPRMASVDSATQMKQEDLPDSVKDAIRQASVKRDPFFGVEVRDS